MNKRRFPLSKPWIRCVSVGMLLVGLVLILWSLANITQNAASLNESLEFNPPVAMTLLAIKKSQISGDIQTILTMQGQVKILSKSVSYPLGYTQGAFIGRLIIPELDLTLPILEGTDDDTLNKGVGHYSESVLPGAQDNCVLSGHRDTVFSKLGQVVIDDLLIVVTDAGTFTYQVTELRIVENDDRTIIVPTDHGVLTLTTCYPFLYTGSASQRYIISADLVVVE